MAATPNCHYRCDAGHVGRPSPPPVDSTTPHRFAAHYCHNATNRWCRPSIVAVDGRDHRQPLICAPWPFAIRRGPTNFGRATATLCAYESHAIDLRPYTTVNRVNWPAKLDTAIRCNSTNCCRTNFDFDCLRPNLRNFDWLFHLNLVCLMWVNHPVPVIRLAMNRSDFADHFDWCDSLYLRWPGTAERECHLYRWPATRMW